MWKAALVAVVIVGVLAPFAAAQNLPYDPDWFRKNNPGYKERVTRFYEASYLDESARNMTAAANHPALTQDRAAGILRGLIHSYLDRYVGHNGTLTRVEHEEEIERADKQVRLLVNDAGTFDRYLKWRKTRDRKVNPLAFLLNHDTGIDPKLSKELRSAGWALENVTEAARLRRYQGHFGIAPDHVLILHNPKMKDSLLRVMIYPTERVRLWQSRNPGKAEELDPFWQTQNYLFYTVEGSLRPEHAAVARYIRNQLLNR